MRLSTNSIYTAPTARLIDLQAQQAELQNQISTGKRINKPSDDPINASRVLSIQQDQSINSQYTLNRDTAQTQMSANENVLSGVTELVLRSQSLIVGAGNGAFSDSDRKAISTELSQNLDQLVSLANSKDGIGNYMFSGYQSSTVPYVKNAVTGAYDYFGDANKTSLQVSSTRQMEISDVGSTVFQGSSNDLFKNLQDAIALLNTPITSSALSATFTAGIATATGNLKTSLDSVLTTRASFGSKLKEIDTLNGVSDTSKIVFDTNLSKLQDLDYTKAISDLSKQSTILEAAQKSFLKTTALSLFNMI